MLRRWGAPPGDVQHDAAALAAAWTDPEVARWTAVPGAHDPAAAARWIAGDPDRWAGGLAVDLVIGSPVDGGRAVLGEVGLAHFDAAGRAEIGFWLAPSARGRGLATAAVTLVTRWALTPAPHPTGPGPGPGAWAPGGGEPGSGEPGSGEGGSGEGGASGGLGLRRVWARTAGDNERAAAVLVRAGFEARGEAAGFMVWTIDAASLQP
jgi:RimJ/RimL family protein N-acetyltransferase